MSAFAQERIVVEAQPPESGIRTRARVADAHNADAMSPRLRAIDIGKPD